MSGSFHGFDGLKLLALSTEHRMQSSEGDGDYSLSFLPSGDQLGQDYRESQEVHQDDRPQSRKRAADSVEDSVFHESSPPKKRFVWPESLHKDFVGAVFDVGLKYSTPKEIQTLLGSEFDASASSADQFKAHLYKLRLFRDKRRFPRQSFYERDGDGGGAGAHAESASHPSQMSTIERDRLAFANHQISMSTLHAMLRGEVPIRDEDIQMVEEACEQHRQLLQRQLDLVQTAIHSQTSFLSLLKTSMAKQNKILTQTNQMLLQHATHWLPVTTGRVRELNPLSTQSLPLTTLTSSSSRYAQPPSFPGLLPPSSIASSTHMNTGPMSTAALSGAKSQPKGREREELSIMSEMRQTMHLHRRLLLQREDQLSLHHASLSTTGAGPETLYPLPTQPQYDPALHLAATQSNFSIPYTSTTAEDMGKRSRAESWREDAPASTVFDLSLGGAIENTAAAGSGGVDSTGLTVHATNFDPDSYEADDLFAFLLTDSGTL